MGSTSVKGWVEVLGATIAAVLLSIVTFQLSGYLIVLAVLPLVFISLRRGVIQGMAASVLTGVIILLMHLNATEVIDGFVTYFGPYAFIGLSGLFARNTQRTLNNKRFSNAALNIVTASLLGSLLFFLWLLIDSGEFVNELIGLGITAGVAAIVLLLVAKVAPKLYIPKDTPFISRKERSRLLND